MRMQAEVISIGDELTSGQRLDTNGQWLSQQLGELGIRVLFHTTVGDDVEAGVTVFRGAMERADVVVTTGGLGPTADDLTRDTIARAADAELILNEEALEHIKTLFARRKREMPQRNVVQAMFPRGSRVIPNPHGTAPGIGLAFERPGREPCRVFALPGVPAEMRDMWHGTVQSALSAVVGEDLRIIRHRTIRCFGAGESDVERMLPDLVRRGRTPQVGITASKATISLRITAEGPTPADCDAVIEPTAQTIYRCLGDLIFGEGDQQLQDVVVQLLRKRGLSLATVDCDTHGILTGWLSTADPEQRVYRGGLVLRDRECAASIVGATGDWPASEPWTAAQVQHMAQRCRAQFGTDYALAIGSFPDPMDTSDTARDVHIALASANDTITKATPFAGHPDIVVARIVKSALNYLRLNIAG